MASSSKISICNVVSHPVSWHIPKIERLSISVNEITYEKSTDNLSLSLRVNNALQGVEETLRGINNGQRDTKVIIKSLFDNLAFIKTHDTVVDKLC